MSTLVRLQEIWDVHSGRIYMAKDSLVLTAKDVQLTINPSDLCLAGLEACELENAEIDKMLHMNTKAHVRSAWGIIVVFALNKDGSPQIGISHININAVARKTAYTIPQMVECLDLYGEAHIHFRSDTSSGYRQIGKDDLDKDKMTSTSNHRPYRFLTLPYGPKNASSTFHLTMDIILPTTKRQFLLVHLGDLFKFSKSVEQHLEHLRILPGLLPRPVISLKLRKCFFFEGRIDYLDQAVQPGRPGLSTTETNPILKIQNPITFTELRSCRGLGNVFWRAN